MYDLKPEIQQVVKSSHAFHIPDLIPDEFFKGYLSWVGRVNGRKRSDDIKIELGAWVKQSMPNVKNVPAVLCLAKLLEVDVEDFIRQHTLAPVKKAIRRASPENYLTEVQSEATKLQSMLTLTGQPMKKEICFCESCTIEDKGYIGRSAWRRSHQITGIDWCSKHGELLLEVSDPDAYEWQPSHYLESGNFTENKISNSSLTPVIQRYMQLIQDALDLTIPLDASVSVQVLAAQASQYIPKASLVSNKQRLSHFVLEQLPNDWVTKHFPYLSGAQHGKYLSGFDDVTRQNGTKKSCIDILLAAAVLFEDADEAMYQLTNQEYTGVKRTKIEIPTPIIVDGYIKNQGNIAKLATDLNVNYHTMIDKVGLLGLPSLARMDTPTMNAIQAFYNGADLLSVMQQPGVNQERFSSVIRVAGSQFSSTIRKFI